MGNKKITQKKINRNSYLILKLNLYKNHNNASGNRRVYFCFYLDLASQNVDVG